MDRSTLTPSKRFEQTAKAAAYEAITAHKVQTAVDFGLIKDVEALKSHIRTLETQNRHLIEEVEQARLDRSLLEGKLVKELGYKEETLLRFQNEKNFQMDQFQLQAEEEIHRVRREAEKQIEGLIRQIKTLEFQVREQTDKNLYLSNQNNKLNAELNELEKELIKNRQATNDLNDRYQQLSLVEKTGQANQKQLEAQRNEMEQEIRILLQIQADKSDTIESLNAKLAKSEASERNLIDQLGSLSSAFEQLEGHIKVFSEKLAQKDKETAELKLLAEQLNGELKLRDREMINLSELNASLRKQIDESTRREKIRENEIRELIAENERVYNEVNVQRHRIHDLAIAYNFAV